jgi:hypothetical protein
VNVVQEWHNYRFEVLNVDERASCFSGHEVSLLNDVFLGLTTLSVQ